MGDVRRNDVIVIAPVTLLCFSSWMLYGADSAELSLIFDAFWGVALIVAVGRSPLRASLFALGSLRLIATAFAILLGYILLSLSSRFPLAGAGVWSWVGDSAGTLDRSATLVEAIKLLGLAAAFATGLCLARSDHQARLALNALCVAVSLYAVWALGQHVFAPSKVLLSTKFNFIGRLTGSFFSANAAAGFLGAMAMLILATIDVRRGPERALVRHQVVDILKFASATLVLGCVVLTASRMGAIAAIVGLCVGFLLYPWAGATNPERWKQVSPQFAAVVLMVGLVVSGQFLMTRLNEMETDGNGRMAVFAAHWDAYLMSPITGYGAGCFSAVNKLITNPNNFGSLWYLRASHNVILQWLEETGIIGTSLICIIIGTILIEIFIGLRVRRSSRAIMRGIICASAVLIVQGMTDFTLQIPAVSLTWSLLLGLAFGVSVGGTREQARLRGGSDAKFGPATKWLPAALGAFTECAALLVLWASGLNAAQRHFPILLTTAYERLAEIAARVPASEPQQRIVRSAANSALRLAPTDAYAWTMLAATDETSASGLLAFQRSYQSDPFDPDLLKWRTAFAAREWARLSPEMHTAVLAEVLAERDIWGARPWLESLARDYASAPVGLALRIVLEQPPAP